MKSDMYCTLVFEYTIYQCCESSVRPSLPSISDCVPSSFPALPPSFSLSCFLQPAWFLMVGGDRSFKLALKEEDEELSDELKRDCEVRGEGGDGKGGRQRRGLQSVR